MIEIKKKQVLIGHKASIYSLAAGQEAGTFYSCGSDKSILSWDPQTGIPSLIAQFPQAVYSILLIQNKHLLLVGLGDGGISVLDLIEKKEIKKLLHHQAALFDLTYSQKHEMIIAASGDGAISFINVASLKCEKIVTLCDQKVRSLALSSDENELAVACGDGSIRLFDLTLRSEKYRISAHDFSANCVCYHPDGSHLLSGGKDAQLCIWGREKSGDLILLSKIPAHNFALYSIKFQQGGKLFATASRDKTVKIWDASNFEFLARINKENFDGHINSVNTIYWSHKDKRQLITAGDDRAILVWNIDMF